MTQQDQRGKFIRAIVALAALLVPVLHIAASSHAAADSSAGASYSYHRDDDASITSVRIDAAHESVDSISPLVFGNFVEHLGDNIYQILWADAILNPNLESDSATDAEPPYWDMTGKAKWLESASGYLSPACVQLSAPDGQIGQRTYLMAQRELSYTLSLYARAPDSAASISVELRKGDDRLGPMLAQTRLSVPDAGWSKHVLHWTIPAGALAVGQMVRIVIEHAGGGSALIDQVQCFPDDAVDGMDPQVLKLARAWKIPVLRLGGNFESGYHWRDGVGPREQRPTVPNLAWGGIESNHFGADEFLDLCRLIGATPQIGANAGNGTADEAAAWLRYCNGRSERVPIWEIGNEQFGDWEIGYTDPAGYAARFVAFRDAMLKVDPRIKIIATGKDYGAPNDGLMPDRDWNMGVLNAAKQSGGRLPDWLSIHPIVPLPGPFDHMPYDQEWESAMAQPTFMGATQIPELIDEITHVEGPHATTRIAPTEWGIVINGDDWAAGPNHDVEAGAVYNALALNTFFRNCKWVTLANSTALLHGGCISRDRGVVYVKPQYYTGRLYSAAQPRFPVQTDVDGPGDDVPQRGDIHGVANVPNVDVFSALNVSRNKLIVFAVNRRLKGDAAVRLDLKGFSVAQSSATILTAADPQAGNSWYHPNQVVPKPFDLRRLQNKPIWTATIPAHSVVVITFLRATS